MVFGKRGRFCTTAEKSAQMARVRSKNSVPELLLCKALWAKGIRYRKHRSDLPGKPDVVITRHKIVIFVDGEFWHGYNWDVKKYEIKTNQDFWIPKIEGNMAKDLQNSKLLAELGYQVIRFWSRQIIKNVDSCAKMILECIKERASKVADSRQEASNNSL